MNVARCFPAILIGMAFCILACRNSADQTADDGASGSLPAQDSAAPPFGVTTTGPGGSHILPHSDDPLVIDAATEGRFANGRAWRLHVESTRAAELTIDTFPEETRRTFVISEDQMKALMRALIVERFFDLNSEYGEHVPDGSAQTLSVAWGSESNSVTIRYLMNWARNDPMKLVEPARAVRAFNVIREWFNDPEAVDLRRYDRMILDAVPASAFSP